MSNELVFVLAAVCFVVGLFVAPFFSDSKRFWRLTFVSPFGIASAFLLPAFVVQRAPRGGGMITVFFIKG